jgi:hypothetical protein
MILGILYGMVYVIWVPDTDSAVTIMIGALSFRLTSWVVPFSLIDSSSYENLFLYMYMRRPLLKTGDLSFGKGYQIM